ncbi:Zinc finger MYND-type [Penicillium coprophilum]|uniref:Zinc finger MYND-type n=1 Tax=Penicillium coprophilum TaxID=36646 RepID=UPI00238C8B15|nr:Zinc finger MYND-type [Penicillium coprophilum]KAJ5154331.1 Zinc finger MYND-type [Penicillium coprophilum]
MSFSSGCGVCGKTDGLRCSGCKVMMYCGVEHQTAHRQEHKSACSAIRRSRVAMEKEEQALRAQPDDIFAHGVGKFWMIFETRPYMRARAALSDAMTVVKSYESLQAQLDILLENLRLCRGDNMGSRDVIPGLMICLQQDQECYDFLK